MTLYEIAEINPLKNERLYPRHFLSRKYHVQLKAGLLTCFLHAAFPPW